jgi:hypothetical protein
MISSFGGIRCTVTDGEVWMHLDDTHVHIPSPIVKKSEVLMDASMCESSASGGFTLEAPTEWLHAWVACFVNEEEQQLLRCAARQVLKNCILVCSCSSITALSALTMSSSLSFDVAVLQPAKIQDQHNCAAQHSSKTTCPFYCFLLACE